MDFYGIPSNSMKFYGGISHGVFEPTTDAIMGEGLKLDRQQHSTSILNVTTSPHCTFLY